jgi:hypothetical protein
MWASMDAIETESAVHVSDFAWLEERKLATALKNQEIRARRMAAANAVFGVAFRTDLPIAYLNFKGRDRRG